MEQGHISRWASALIPFDYSDSTMKAVIELAERHESGYAPSIAMIKGVVRQVHENRKTKKQLPEPGITPEERSTAQKHLAEIKKILDEAGEKMSMERKARYEMPNQVREKSEPIYWDQNQCPDPDCLTKHRAEDCPKRKRR
jgi:hypothetical protein